MKLLSEKIQYEKYNWNICGDLKVTALSAWLADWLHNGLLRSVFGRTENITSKFIVLDDNRLLRTEECSKNSIIYP